MTDTMSDERALELIWSAVVAFYGQRPTGPETQSAFDHIAARLAQQPAAAGEGMAVVEIRGMDEYGPMLNWFRHWTELPIGTKLYAQALAQRALPDGWQPIETAPKGGGAEMRTDPAWIEPPEILLLFPDGKVSVAYWDWFYAEGGRGCTNGIAWIEPVSGEQVSQHYGNPTHWMPKPAAPSPEVRA